MAEHDWVALHTALDQATGSYGREELVALLRDLIREYVIERGLPTGTPQQAATPDVANLAFADLVVWLKRVSNAPELQLFSLDGRRVIVDLDGPREIKIDRAATPSAATPGPRPGPRIEPAAPRPAAAPLPEPEPEPADEAAPKRSLSRGFRGLEFD
jgi:hypothetical protein